MVTRATWVYLAMLTVFCIGLWSILKIGSSYQAPADLAGEWKLHTSAVQEDDPSGPTLRIEQSGRFFRMTFDDKVVSLRLESQEPLKKNRACQMRLVGEGVDVVMRGTPDADEMDIHAQGAVEGQWLAVRILRKHPTRGRGTGTTKPA